MEHPKLLGHIDKAHHIEEHMAGLRKNVRSIALSPHHSNKPSPARSLTGVQTRRILYLQPAPATQVANRNSTNVGKCEQTFILHVFSLLLVRNSHKSCQALPEHEIDHGSMNSLDLLKVLFTVFNLCPSSSFRLRVLRYRKAKTTIADMQVVTTECVFLWCQ